MRRHQPHSKTTPTFRLISRPPASFPDHSHLPLLQYSENQRIVTLMRTIRAATEIVTRIRQMEVWLIVFLCILRKTHSVMWMVCGYLPQSQGHWQWSCVVTQSQAVYFFGLWPWSHSRYSAYCSDHPWTGETCLLHFTASGVESSAVVLLKLQLKLVIEMLNLHCYCAADSEGRRSEVKQVLHWWPAVTVADSQLHPM